MVKKCIGFVLIFCCSALLWAQKTHEIKGKVVDLHNNIPLENAMVKIGKITTFTDNKGEFLLSFVPSGEHLMKIIHTDCDDFTQNIKVKENLSLSIAMEHHTKNIETVTLSGVTKPTKTQQVTTIQTKKLEENFDKNIGNLLSNISGVSTLKTGNNIVKPILRGLYGSRISIFSEGIKLSEQEWGVEHAPSVEASMFQKISLIKGAGVLKHSGDAMGGIILLENKPLPAKDTLMGNTQLAGFTNGQGLKLGINLQKSWKNKWFITSGGNFLKSGDIYIPHHTLQNTASQEQTFHLKFGHRSFEKGTEMSYSFVGQNFGIFTGSHLGTASQLYDVLKNGGAKEYYDNFHYRIQNPKQEVAHHITKIEGYHRFRKIGKILANYSLQINERKEYDIRRGQLNEIPSLDLQLTTHQGKITHTLEREKWTLETGLFAEYQNNYADPNTQARRLIPDYKKYNSGAFSMLEYTLSPKWTAEIALRYDFNRIDAYKYYDQNIWNSRFATLYPHFEVQTSGSRILTNPILNFHNFSTNAGLRYTQNENLNYKLNFARISRMPNPAELFADGLHHSAALVERGDLGLKSETMTQINTSIEAKFPLFKGIKIDLSPYYYRSTNFIQQVPTGIQNSNRGAFVIWDYQQVSASLWGFETEINIVFSQFELNSQYSWLRGYNHSQKENLVLMSPPRLKSRLDFTPIPKQKISIGMEHLFVQKQNFFPIHNVEFDTIEHGNLVYKTIDISTPPNAYHLFDVFINSNISKKTNISLRVSNIFNTEYRDYLNRLRFFSPEAGRNISISLKHQF